MQSAELLVRTYCIRIRILNSVMRAGAWVPWQLQLRYICVYVHVIMFTMIPSTLRAGDVSCVAMYEDSLAGVSRCGEVEGDRL